MTPHTPGQPTWPSPRLERARDLRGRPALAYPLAVVLIVAATLLRQFLSRWIGPVDLPFLTLFPALIIAAWLLGSGPTLLALVLGLASADFFFLAPVGTFFQWTPVSLVGLTMFAVVGVGLAVLGDREHRARRAAELQADENIRLRDLAEEAASQAEEEASRAEEEGMRAEENAEQARALVAEREQGAAALRFLGEASAALGGSLEYETTLATVARLAIPALADWCAIDLAQPDGTLRRIAITHVDPAREAWGWELERRFPPQPGEGGSYDVLRNGQSRYVPDITPDMLDMPGRDPEYLRILRELGLVSYIGVPLIAHGAVFGVLSFLMSESGRHYTSSDLRLAEVLGERAAVAVDNAQRHRESVESVNMLQAVLAASPVGQAFVDQELRYVQVNPALAALHGVPVETHADRRIRDVLPAWAEVLEPLHRQVFETGQPILDHAITVAAPSGGDYELMVSCFPVRDAEGVIRWVGVTKADVTEQRAGVRALRASEARLRRVVESPLIGIGFYDHDGRITGANGALCDLLGYTPREIEAGALRWDTNLTPPEFRDRDERAAREIRETGASRAYEKEMLRKDGSRVPVLVGGSRLDEEGNAGVFYVLDLTERRRVEEQAQAAQRLEAVGRLAGGVAHEINNALQGVIGFNGFILNRTRPGEPLRDDAEKVQRSAERAARITQQLLAYSRRQVLQQVDLDLTRVVNDFSPMLRQALGPDRDLVVTHPRGAAMVHADRTQLEQVLLNLALNARDAMVDGGRLTIAIERTAVSQFRPSQHGGGRLEPGDYVQLTVTDAGIGMDPATRARVFEPFFTTKPVGHGTGLGLSVVHGIVRQTGGHVWIYGEPGEGTTVSILLPDAGVAAADREATLADARANAVSPAGGSERILVVDDEPVVLGYLAELLRKAGYEVLQATHGEQALELFRARSDGAEPAALVITDLVMPGIGGRALGEALAAVAPGVPILYSSGYTGDEVARRGLIAEGSEFMPKPFLPDELLLRVRQMLDRRGGDE